MSSNTPYYVAAAGIAAAVAAVVIIKSKALCPYIPQLPGCGTDDGGGGGGNGGTACVPACAAPEYCSGGVCVGGAGAQLGSISGVTRTTDWLLIGGVTIELFKHTTDPQATPVLVKTVTSASNGNYKIENIPAPGIYRLRWKAKSGYDGGEEAPVEVGTSNLNLDRYDKSLLMVPHVPTPKFATLYLAASSGQVSYPEVVMTTGQQTPECYKDIKWDLIAEIKKKMSISPAIKSVSASGSTGKFDTGDGWYGGLGDLMDVQHSLIGKYGDVTAISPVVRYKEKGLNKTFQTLMGTDNAAEYRIQVWGGGIKNVAVTIAVQWEE